ncbi:uncharacterized protein VTP21DRAFT_2113 [Calcarisporiella thermophila]|uniref:uncharacterized protein n=1 Tax=Calcarisporiella thermophila TaxID=911321 RepID=UPI0037432C0C
MAVVLADSNLEDILRRLTQDPSESDEFLSSSAFEDVLLQAGERLLIPYSSNTSNFKDTLSFLVISKCLESATAPTTRVESIITRLSASTKLHDRKLAAACHLVIFRTRGDVGESILMKEGFLQELMDGLEDEPTELQVVISELIAEACSSQKCRATIYTYCSNYLDIVMKQKSADPRLRSAAAIASIKVRMNPQNQGGESTINEVSDRNDDTEFLAMFREMIISDSSASTLLNAIEGLSYSSLQPDVKEKLVQDEALLKAIFNLAKKALGSGDEQNGPLQYGVAIIIQNLVAYRPRLTEEQQQMQKLSRMVAMKQRQKEGKTDKANDTDTDSREEDVNVEKRIAQVTKLGGITALVQLAKSTSQNVKQMVALALLHISTPQSERGQIIQQGGIRALISLLQGNTKEGQQYAAHALAKITITTDPRLAFRQGNISDMVRPFIELLKGEDGLRQFEGLMALTNLCSVDDAARERVVQLEAIGHIEQLQISDNTLIRRAATECLCNLMFCEAVFARYVNANRIHLLLALSDVEDFETRRAASGALAILSNAPEVCKLIADNKRGFEVLSALVEEESPEAQHRGAECLKNMASCDNKEIAEKMVKAGIVEKLAQLARKSRVEPIVRCALEAVKAIHNSGVLST